MEPFTDDRDAFDAAVRRLDGAILVAYDDAVQAGYKGDAYRPLAAEILANVALQEMTHEQLYEYAVVMTGVAAEAVRQSFAGSRA